MMSRPVRILIGAMNTKWLVADQQRIVKEIQDDYFSSYNINFDIATYFYDDMKWKALVGGNGEVAVQQKSDLVIIGCHSDYFRDAAVNQENRQACQMFFSVLRGTSEHSIIILHRDRNHSILSKSLVSEKVLQELPFQIPVNQILGPLGLLFSWRDLPSQIQRDQIALFVAEIIKRKEHVFGTKLTNFHSQLVLKSRQAIWNNWNLVKKRGVWDEENTIQDVSSAIFSEGSETESNFMESKSIVSLYQEDSESAAINPLYTNVKRDECRADEHSSVARSLNNHEYSALNPLKSATHSETADCFEIQNCEYFAADIWNRVRCSQKLSCLNMPYSLSWSNEDPTEAAVHVICSPSLKKPDTATRTSDTHLRRPFQCVSKEVRRRRKLFSSSQVVRCYVASQLGRTVKQSLLTDGCGDTHDHGVGEVRHLPEWNKVETSISETSSPAQYKTVRQEYASGDEETLVEYGIQLTGKDFENNSYAESVHCMETSSGSEAAAPEMLKKKKGIFERCCHLQ